MSQAVFICRRASPVTCAKRLCRADFILWRADSPKQLIFKIIDQMSYLQQYIRIQRLRRASPPRRDLFGLHKLSKISLRRANLVPIYYKLYTQYEYQCKLSSNIRSRPSELAQVLGLACLHISTPLGLVTWGN